jgi:NAD+ kinase
MKIHFFGSPKAAAQSAVQQLTARYGQNEIGAADYVVAIGGDGTTLNALQAVRAGSRAPVFAMRLPDSVGALGNSFEIADLDKRLQTARSISIRPLRAEVATATGRAITCFGINEIVVSRARLQAAKLQVTISDMAKPRALVGDGVLVATPLGTSGYNQAAGGPLLPWSSRLLALTGIVVRTPSDWRNTVVDDRTTVMVDVIDPLYRPVRLETNAAEVAQIARVQISCDSAPPLTLLFGKP